MHSQNLPQEIIHKIVEIITQQLGTCTVYLLNSRISNHSLANFQVNTDTVSPYYCCILVLTKNNSAITASNLANTIAEQSARTIFASILLHKLSDLNTKQSGLQHFFDKAIRNSQRLCLDKSAPPYIMSNTIPPRDFESDKTFWQKCVAVAQFNIQAAKESPQLEVELCKIALLNTACTQIALGLIRIGLGYIPNEFGLNYLLQLCTHFTTLPTQIFSQQTPLAAKRYKMLCAPPSMLNHWTKLYAPEEDFLYLLDTTQQFLDQSYLFVTLSI
ncbi:hypothetical protein [Flavobacterium terrisoli]|uniref:hypothetical protein n=1 Tax=Flavobacterium terrisoli TaxID=3242195 RepID=UPI00254369E6|nr:hypothetical protein [Flavobacterium buctense]